MGDEMLAGKKVEEILAKMEKVKANDTTHKIVDDGINYMWNRAKKATTEEKKKLIDMGCIDLIINGMKKNKYDEKIQRLGCGSLFSFADDMDLATELVKKYEVHKYIIDAMIEFHDEYRIQPYGMSSLHQLIKVEGAIPLFVDYGMDEEFVLNTIRVRGDWPYEINGTQSTIAQFAESVLPDIAACTNVQNDIKRGLLKFFRTIPLSPDAAKLKIENVAHQIEHFEILQHAEKQTKQKKVHIFLAAIVLNVLLVIVSAFHTMLGLFVSRVTGFVYPAFCSFRAIETGHKYDDVHWITYWFVFGAFTLFEESILKQLETIPFPYFWVKSLILLWCFHPITCGSKLIYKEGKKAVANFLAQL